MTLYNNSIASQEDTKPNIKQEHYDVAEVDITEGDLNDDNYPSELEYARMPFEFERVKRKYTKRSREEIESRKKKVKNNFF